MSLEKQWQLPITCLPPKNFPLVMSDLTPEVRITR
jgi:hypothetical protein